MILHKSKNNSNLYIVSKNKKLDKKFNEHIKRLNNKENIVIDSRIGFLFIKKGIHLFLDADLDLRAKRIFKDKRKLENFKTVNEVKKEMRSGEDRKTKVCDELGDTLHYLTRLAQLYGYSLEDVMDFNMTKLTLRKVKTNA